MYKPPANSNRVKTIKSKFENIEKSNEEPISRNGIGHNVKPVENKQLELQRQLSDPAKRNIKRTPAFRAALQRNPTNKVDNCDINSNLNNDKPILYKSKSSIDFNQLRNRFNAENSENVPAITQTNQRKESKTKNVSALYTQPIPRSLRPRSVDPKPIYSNITGSKESIERLSNEAHNCTTLKVTDKERSTTDPNSALKKLDTLLELTKTNSLKKKSEVNSITLTDTLRNALKKPLPKGPAPEKPPRTFTHRPQTKRSDPKYMLDKLETALRNNKLRSKKRDTSVSGEESDDSPRIPSVPENSSRRFSPSSNEHNTSFVQALNLNCLNGYSCVSSPYTKLDNDSASKSSTSEFFVKLKREEPVYAEPWHFESRLEVRDEPRARSASGDRNSRNKRNSLYYMSSPVLCIDTANNKSTAMSVSTKQTDVPSSNQKLRSEKCHSSEVSSLSSYTSDSTMEDEKVFEAVNIKQLITVFEKQKIDTKGTENAKTTGAGVLDIDDRRLYDLEDNIRKTIDDCFEVRETVAPATDRKSSVDDPTVKKFRTYVRNVSVYAKTKPSWRRSTLFDCCLIVEWNADVRRIKFKFPHNVEVPHKIEDLCFPDAACGPLDKTLHAQVYSLVITNDKGERTFGYCRRVVPEGSNKCLPIAYCILSKYKSPRFYKKILIELESRHGMPEHHRDSLLRAFYYNKFPQPGESVNIKLIDEIGCGRNKEIYTNAKNELEESLESNYVIVNEKGESVIETATQNLDDINCDIILNLHHDPIYENSDLKDLHELPSEILQKIFATLLLERKVILISCLLSKLSSCVEALQTIIYPFIWPHSFIPVLPRSLWEFVESPTPIICGILSIEVINEHDIEHGIVVDLDEKSILKQEGDEDKAMCGSMVRTWRKSMASLKNIPTDIEGHSYHLTEAYTRVFSMALRNYRDYIVNGNFQKEAFISSHKKKGVRKFLNWFTDTTMFLTFVDAVITNSQDFSLFDKKIALYGNDNSSLILDKILNFRDRSTE